MSKGILLFDALLALLLLSLYLPLLIQGILSINLVITKLYDYQTMLSLIQAHINYGTISVDDISIYHQTDLVTTFAIDTLNVPIRWVHIK